MYINGKLKAKMTGSDTFYYFSDALGSTRLVWKNEASKAASRPATLNQFTYCMNDPINRMNKDGQWSFKKLLKSFVSTATSLVSNAIEAAVDIVVTIVETMIEVVQKVVDAAARSIEDVKEAVEDVAEVAYAGFQAIQKAWDNLDSGLRQWIINGIAMAVSFVSRED